MTAAAQLSDAPVQAEGGTPPWTPATDSVDNNLLHGLAALANLLSNASETLNQCLLTIEETLRAESTTQEEWLSIPSTRAAVERAQTDGDEQTSQECVFGGVAVTILKLAPANQPAGTEWEYQLGYSRTGEHWSLMVRTATLHPSEGGEGVWRFSDLKPLREAALEIRLKGIREIPGLLKLLDSHSLPAPSGDPITPESLEACDVPQACEAPQICETPQTGEAPQTCEVSQVCETPEACEVPETCETLQIC